MKDQVFSILQAVGRSFMLPVAILPIAGLLLGIGASFTNATTIQDLWIGKRPRKRHDTPFTAHHHERCRQHHFR